MTTATQAPNPYSAPWHRVSMDAFFNEYLPGLFGAIVQPFDYKIEEIAATVRRITVAGNGYRTMFDAPYPDADGVFTIGGESRYALPVASLENLEQAQIACVGEQLARFLADEQRGPMIGFDFGAAIRAFFERTPRLEPFSFLSRSVPLRRIRVEGEITGFHPSQLGRICYIETPEGPNCGRFLHIARGATIENGKIQPLRNEPADRLGLTAALIPFISHSEPARTLMGANMARQMRPVAGAEPALVQTGNEPDNPTPDFWYGVNLLTAFVSWGPDSHEDAIILSESAARKLAHDKPLSVGDKVANRHGSKGVISRVLPDDQMPHRMDGTPAEIIYSFFSVPTRMNHGQLLEAVLGNLARKENAVQYAAPFAGPTVAELQARLAAAGLPASGMERLTNGKNGPALSHESAIGVVYWGRIHPDARVEVTADEPGGQNFGLNEYHLLREYGATHTLHALTSMQANDGPDARFARLAERLHVVGIRAAKTESGVSFAFAAPADGLPLARPVPHPFRPERTLTHIGKSDLLEFDAVREANDRLARIVTGNAPESLRARAEQTLNDHVKTLADALLEPLPFAFETDIRFSGRAVTAPGSDLPLDTVGLPDDMAWRLFAPETTEKTPDAARRLDERMAQSWVIVNHQPSLYPTSLVAFRPVRVAESVIRLHPLICNWMETDFDGDQIAVFLPLGDAAQREAEELLTVKGHLRRDPALLSHPRRDPSLLSRPFGGLVAGHAMLYGLAEMSRTPQGKAELAAILRRDISIPGPFLERAPLMAALDSVLREEGIDAALAVILALYQRGFAAAKMSGASLGPFVGQEYTMPSPEERRSLAEWKDTAELLVDNLTARAARGEMTDDALDPTLLSAACGARGRISFLAKITASVSPGTQIDPDGNEIPMRHGWRDGVTPDELETVAAAFRPRLLEMVSARPDAARFAPSGLGVLARAFRSHRPGIIFAQAAVNAERDPLADLDSRLWMGLPPL